MKKGFTLMEMLAVVLLVALLMSFALPVYRTIRFEMRHSQAEQAAVKMAEAMRSFYAHSKGGYITGSFNPTETAGAQVMMSAESACTDRLKSGIPNTSGGEFTIAQLFACGYLSYKDFQGLPYEFTANGTGEPLVTATGKEQAGKFRDKTIQVSKKMYVIEDEE